MEVCIISWRKYPIDYESKEKKMNYYFNLWFKIIIQAISIRRSNYAKHFKDTEHINLIIECFVLKIENVKNYLQQEILTVIENILFSNHNYLCLSLK